ncbi:MAG TPA: pyridoxamine 5'-phosphate oxidase family protein [Mycobacterium sp.]|nr:pyridoxamine 5'-phosphate oxidase family protein [Mycobacterium sp.]
MAATDEPVTVLGEDESWELLTSVALGRLVTCVGSRPEIFPVNFVVQRPTVLFRTAEGTKLLSVVINKHVVFEADSHSLDDGWSVIVQGTAEILSTSAELDEADRAGLRPWVATLKLRYVRIHASTISGRRFRFGPEPDRESAFA